MREVLAATNHDFVLTGPVSRLRHLREKLLTASRRGSRRTGRRGRHYLTIFAIGFLIATAAAIVLNALLWQRTRHPAPLFSRAASGTSKKQSMIGWPIAVPLPRPQPAVAPVQAQDKPVEKLVAQKSPVEKPPLEITAGEHSRQTRITSSPPHDEISQLLKAAPEPPARPTKGAAASAARSKLVLAAQRALVKLGFVLNPDGVAGPMTRQAIERYEREQGLPVRGDLSSALMRQLSAATGIAIH